MIEDRQLGEAAMKYLRDTLAAGDRLANYLLEEPLEGGQVHAYLPENIDPERITSFGADVFWTEELNPDDDWVARSLDLVLWYVKASQNNLALWEGWPEKLDREPLWSEYVNHFWDDDGIWAVWDGPGRSRSESRTAYIYVLSGADEWCIVKAFRNAWVYPTVCVLTELRDGPDLPAPPFVVSRSLLASLATHAAHILVGAFDERSLIIWSRTGRT